MKLCRDLGSVLLIVLHAPEKDARARLGLRPRLPAHAVKGNKIGSVRSGTASGQPEKAVLHRIKSISAIMFLRLATASLSRAATQGPSALLFLRLATASLSRVVMFLKI